MPAFPMHFSTFWGAATARLVGSNSPFMYVHLVLDGLFGVAPKTPLAKFCQ